MKVRSGGWCSLWTAFFVYWYIKLHTVQFETQHIIIDCHFCNQTGKLIESLEYI